MSATPSPARKRRRVRPRDSIEDDEDEYLLDEMLVELGIPGGRSRRRNSVSSSASVEVIELISPPRDAQLLAARKKENDSPVFVDLTTPPPSPCASSSTSNGCVDRVQEVAEMEDEVEDFSVLEDGEQQDEISFSYSPSESPPPFTYSLPPEARGVDAEAGGAGSPSSPEVFSPDLPPAARRQVVLPDERRQRGPKQARRLSGRLEDLHSETMRTTGSSARTKSAASPSRSSSGARSGGSSAVATGVMAVVQMEKSLDASAAGGSIREALKSHVYNGKPVPFTVSTALSCIRPGVIRWERRESSHSHVSCAIYYEAGAFLDMLRHKSYTELVAAVRYIQSLAPQPQRSRQSDETEESSKFFVIVEGLDRALIELKKRQKKKKGTSASAAASSSMIAFADLHEVAFQLFMDVGAHTKFTSDVEATAEYVALLTRELVLASSRTSALEEFLESVPRYNSFRVTHSGGTASASANAWLRMLQVIPGVSEDKAQCLLDHFPTYASLMRAYRDPRLSRAEKEDLVADKLHDARIQRALSKRIFAVFCEENPDAVA
jgi:hypothetical protein